MLRVSVTDLNEASTLASSALKPYRIEKECLHFDVTTEDELSLTDTVKTIQSFFKQHQKSLQDLSASPKVRAIELDIAVPVIEQDFVKNLRFDPAFLTVLVNLNIALNLSIYSPHNHQQ